MPRVLGGSSGGVRFFVSKVPLYIDEVADAVSYHDEDNAANTSRTRYKHEVASYMFHQHEVVSYMSYTHEVASYICSKHDVASYMH